MKRALVTIGVVAVLATSATLAAGSGQHPSIAAAPPPATTAATATAEPTTTTSTAAEPDTTSTTTTTTAPEPVDEEPAPTTVPPAEEPPVHSCEEALWFLSIDMSNDADYIAMLVDEPGMPFDVFAAEVRAVLARWQEWVEELPAVCVPAP